MRDKISIIPDDNVINKIYFIRNQKVMIDRDLAMLYGVETKVFKQAARRNVYIDFLTTLCLNYPLKSS